MTIRRNEPEDAHSNYFNRLLNGIGARGSSFSDIDAYTHDRRTDRILIQEFKWDGEELSGAQREGLVSLGKRHDVTVWCVRRRKDGLLDWWATTEPRKAVITTDEYQARFGRWWKCEQIIQAPEVFHESEINWSFQDSQPAKKQGAA